MIQILNKNISNDIYDLEIIEKLICKNIDQYNFNKNEEEEK